MIKLIGKILGNRYHIIERIGGGGMADVYKAHDDKLDREVAVKVLKQEFVDDADFVDKFKKESHAAARLNHNNIVGVFDVGIDEIDDFKCYYIVMEIVEGKTLKEIIKEKGHLTVPEAINYTYQISDALIKAHENGIIHRDIKPQNIIVNNSNIAKVTDFGIAKAASNVTVQSNNDILGSVHYFSPEQARGANTDERSDIYSLGIVLYEMLTGELPFDAENPISIALKQVQEQMKAPSSINPEVPEALDRIVLRMTDKKPENRYRNVRHVINDLRHLNIDLQSVDSSDTVLIPRVNNPRPMIDKSVTADDQRRIRRSSIESTNKPRPEPVNNAPRGNKGKSAVSIILGILFALVVATGGFYLLFQWWINQPTAIAKEVVAPNLLGVQEETAKKVVEDLNLKFEVTDRLINPDYEPGDVIYQSVEAGVKVKEGFTIRVTINNIAEEVEVRNYLTLDYEETLELLESHGLELGTTEYEEVDEDEVGKILKQDLKVGTMVKTGSKVSFVVGEAKEIKMVEMPDLIGLTEARAESLLKQYKLEKGEVSEDYSDKVDKGEVIDQNIDVGKEVEEGTKIDFTISIGSLADKEKDKEPEKTTTEPPKEEPGTNTTDTNTENEGLPPVTIGLPLPDDQDTTVVKIIRDVNGKQEVVYNETHFASEKNIIVTLEGVKDATYEVYFNGVLVPND